MGTLQQHVPSVLPPSFLSVTTTFQKNFRPGHPPPPLVFSFENPPVVGGASLTVNTFFPFFVILFFALKTGRPFPFFLWPGRCLSQPAYPGKPRRSSSVAFFFFVELLPPEGSLAPPKVNRWTSAVLRLCTPVLWCLLHGSQGGPPTTPHPAQGFLAGLVPVPR